jgi:NTP pyrophosphatase (non-canonical NTP hydrolase)
MTYCIYHIPGKKIGVTTDLDERVTRQQGYESHEYEVLAMSDCIEYISGEELRLQKLYGYKVDEKLYKDLKPNIQTNMRINITEQTTTFPCPTSKLKGQLLDNIGMEWQTDHGVFHIDQGTIDWIMNNVKTSRYNNERCYVYNKAFSRYYDNHQDLRTVSNHTAKKCYDKDCNFDTFEKIRDWAHARGIYNGGDLKTQYIKLMEESGELSRAILKGDNAEFKDAIGDMVVVLTNLAKLNNMNIEDCINSAYSVIANRKGKMVNGTFVKSESLGQIKTL